MKPITFIPSLTPLRGIAATLVVLFHFDLFLVPLVSEGNMMVDKLYLMVDLFFVLSGFIMYHVYGSWFAQGIGQERFLTFMKARFARLYPLHLFMLVYMLIWAGVLWMQLERSAIPEIVQSILDPKAIPTSLLLVQAWGMHFNAPWNPASWSISVEWMLYMLFPFLIYFMARFKSSAKWILGSIAVGGLLLIMYWIKPHYELLWAEAFGMEPGPNSPRNTIDLITGPALLRGFCGFVIGMIAYEAYQKQWMKPLLQKGFWFLSIFLPMFALWMGDWLPDVVAVGLFGILILHASYVEGLTKKILNNRVFTYLGDISFSIYMVHIPLILSFFMFNMMQGNMPDPGAEPAEINLLANWTGALIFLAISIGVASLTYRFIELPMRSRLKRYFSGSKPQLV